MADKSDNRSKVQSTRLPSTDVEVLVICPHCGYEETVHIEATDLSDLIIQQFLLTNDEDIEIEIVVQWDCSHCGVTNEIGGDYEDSMD